MARTARGRPHADDRTVPPRPRADSPPDGDRPAVGKAPGRTRSHPATAAQGNGRPRSGSDYDALPEAAPGYGVRLARAELAPRRLWARAALVVCACAGCGFLGSGLYDHTHVGRPEGLAADLSLGGGALLVVVGTVLLVPRSNRSRERRRLLAAHGLPHRDDAAARALAGRRAAWLALSALGLVLAVLFAAAGLQQAFSPGTYEDPDPTVYGVLLAWAAILSAAGCRGTATARRYRVGSRGGTTHTATGGAGPHPAEQSGSPRNALYARLGGRPAAPHRLRAGLDARLDRLPRRAAVALAVAATLPVCALGAAPVLVTRHLGGGTGVFWTLLAAALLAVLVLLLELTHYGPRRRYLLLVILAGIALVPVTHRGHSTSLLLDRGTWVDVEVTDVHDPPRYAATCRLQPRGTERAAAWGDLRIPCHGADVGDRFRVFADPRGEGRPSRSKPTGMAEFHLAFGADSAVLLGCAVSAARYGHRRRRELGLDGQQDTV